MLTIAPVATAVDSKHAGLCQRQGKSPQIQIITASNGQMHPQYGKYRNLISERQAATKQ